MSHRCVSRDQFMSHTPRHGRPEGKRESGTRTKRSTWWQFKKLSIRQYSKWGRERAAKNGPHCNITEMRVQKHVNNISYAWHSTRCNKWMFHHKWKQSKTKWQRERERLRWEQMLRLQNARKNIWMDFKLFPIEFNYFRSLKWNKV